MEPRQHREARRRAASDDRQPDRSEYRHLPLQGHLRQRRRRALPESVRQRATASRRATPGAHPAHRGHPPWRAGDVGLRRQAWQDRRHAGGAGRVEGRNALGRDGRQRGRARRHRRRRQAPAARQGRAGRRRRPPQKEMNPSRIFILRPVATSLLMVAILLAGIIAFRELPVSALPQVDYPTIQVLTFYPGASPDVMTSSVTAPMERQFGQIPGLQQMSSTSSFGGSMITLQFDLKQNIDVAEQEVQAAINASASFLPRALPNPPTYRKVNPADTPILTLGLTSTQLPLSKVEDLADTTLAQKISQLPGVGLVTISGGQKPAVRIQANPAALASYGLSLEDLRTGLAAANTDQAKGNLQGPAQSFSIGAYDQIFSSSDYKPVIIAYRNGAPVRVGDVAQVVEGGEAAQRAAGKTTTPAVIMNVQRQPGANTINVVDRIEHLLPQLTSSLPPTVKVAVLTDRTVTIRASVRDVEFELRSEEQP